MTGVVVLWVVALLVARWDGPNAVDCGSASMNGLIAMTAGVLCAIPCWAIEAAM